MKEVISRKNISLLAKFVERATPLFEEFPDLEIVMPSLVERDNPIYGSALEAATKPKSEQEPLDLTVADNDSPDMVSDEIFNRLLAFPPVQMPNGEFIPHVNFVGSLRMVLRRAGISYSKASLSLGYNKSYIGGIVSGHIGISNNIRNDLCNLLKTAGEL
jgi:hypothetical protein